MNPRVLTATALVAAVHVALLAVILTLRHDPVQPALESRVMTAQLLPPAPVAAPAAVQSVAPPPPTPTPPVHSKPKVQPKPTPKPTPAPLREAPAPSPVTVAPPEPAAPAAPAAPPTPAAPAAPAIGRQTMEISAPKNVSHLDCNIAKPDYPALSRRRGETGTAYVKFVVGLTGKLENIELKKSSGFSRLDDAALAAAHASACKPYLEDGQPIRAAYTQPYNFNLED
ncbi:outer membrane transport energization protein TonB [Paraburkholderia sp. GV068]|jgi:protein TonB|uniref:Protein TonB n=5 Tax=Burkholderiaceae TaxID=119060 RepID=A0ABD5CQI6_9BURK|nr:protein TonB [Paraburkholderia graminis]MDR6474451.1 protein TonB [Paraburkholderia graminis]PTQ91868.1 outer membrane transport energization protein TonB [Paraburkholderia sp. GV072]PUA94078.1 outer membrane transport energization protein TonB [Paraburkholderia sp. GV068]